MPPCSRRQFARDAAAAAIAITLLPKRAGAADATKPRPATASAHPAPKLALASQAEADARVAVIVARYGARLSPTERADLQRMSNDTQPLLEQLRAYPLDWADEPAHIFRAPRRRK